MTTPTATAATIEQARAVLRATVLPRSAARDYRITTATDSQAAPWGQAMACAQLSLRNGAMIRAHRGGAFTLTRPDGTNPVRWSPEPRRAPGQQTEHDQHGHPTTPDGGWDEYGRSMATRRH